MCFYHLALEQEDVSVKILLFYRQK